ncbi:hypothetical protein KVR01_013304 [Diaporthe batatas]|uniref:uncharacterized protein n=1 Tax=Diaporthe batatas TaxID=748121 RepID=UPI001D0398F1|nr:uncharacterized protein KVR01_013304 [Diaporthe batatas]KAG8156891.1 hypothetical protein KVR01_013304 [Diaporthe batatas]
MGPSRDYNVPQQQAPGYYEEDAPPPYSNMQPRQPQWSAGVTMIRSLISQLLSRVPDGSIPMTSLTLEDIRSGSIHVLCNLFSRLLQLLPDNAIVWCLVDGVDNYEQAGLWNGAGQVLERLARLSGPFNHSPRPGASVRLLLTTSTLTSYTSTWLQRQEMVWLEETGWEHREADMISLGRGLANQINQAHGSKYNLAHAMLPRSLGQVARWTVSLAATCHLLFILSVDAPTPLLLIQPRRSYYKTQHLLGITFVKASFTKTKKTVCKSLVISLHHLTYGHSTGIVAIDDQDPSTVLPRTSQHSCHSSNCGQPFLWPKFPTKKSSVPSLVYILSPQPQDRTYLRLRGRVVAPKMRPPQGPRGQDGPVIYSIPHIASCIGGPDILPDVQRLTESRETAMTGPERAHAEQLVRKYQFRQWLESPTSSQLVVHGNYRPGGSASGLSFVCLSLANKLSEYGNHFIPLMFFCGMNKDDDGGVRTGGRALIRSFIYQLLGHACFRGSPGVALSPQTLDRVRNGDIEALTGLFSHLVSLTPPQTTVCCLVDGALYYERDEFWDGFVRALRPLLQLSGQTRATHTPLKLLITSPTPTSYVRDFFPGDVVLSMAGIGRAGVVPSTQRLERELALAIQYALEVRLEQEQGLIAAASGSGSARSARLEG